METVLILLQIAALALTLNIKNVAALPLEEDLDTSVPGGTTVPIACDDEQKYCECPSTATNCILHLRLYSMYTFTSYKKTLKKGAMVIDFDQPGTTYYLNENGYRPSYHYDSEAPPCYINNYSGMIIEADFAAINCTVPLTVDGNTYRSVITINGIIPAPTIIGTENQVLRIRSHNYIDDSAGTSIHWHGMFQKITHYIDGMGTLSHESIPKNSFFDYVFKLEPPGTHWFHSHVGSQRGDGLFGSLVVKETTPQYTTYDGQSVIDSPELYTISLIEWNEQSSQERVLMYKQGIRPFPHIPQGKVPTSNDPVMNPDIDNQNVNPGTSVLLSGKGQYTPSTFTKLNIFNVAHSSQYHFRLVGANGNVPLRFSIQGHKLILIGADGFYIEASGSLDYIIFHAGERYDFILQANQDVDNYRIIVTNNDADTVYDNFDGILHYTGAPTPDYSYKYQNVIDRQRECTYSNMCKAVNCPVKFYKTSDYIDCLRLDELNALTPDPHTPQLLNSSDPNLKFFDFGFELGPTINAVKHVDATVPYASVCTAFDTDVSNGDICFSGNKSTCVHVTQIAQDNVFADGRSDWPSVNFVFSALTTGGINTYHPIHLHGHSYHVVAQGYGVYNPDDGSLTSKNEDISCDSTCSDPHWTNNQRPASIGSVVRPNAIRKDTIIVPSGGYVVVAFIADNTGYWFMHCHIENHQLGGMAIIVQEYNAGEQWYPPSNIYPIGRGFRWSLNQFYATVQDEAICVPQY